MEFSSLFDEAFEIDGSRGPETIVTELDCYSVGLGKSFHYICEMSGSKASKKGRGTVNPVLAAESSLPTENKRYVFIDLSKHGFKYDIYAALRRFQPGPNFKAVSSCTNMDESSIHDGKKELWLLQFPKDVSLKLMSTGTQGLAGSPTPACFMHAHARIALTSLI